MAREKANYRDELEQLIEYFKGKRILTLSDVERYTRRDRRWCQRIFSIDPKTGISIVSLAKQLSSF